MKAAKKIADGVYFVFDKINFVAGLALVAMLAITTLDVVFRATGLFNGSVRGSMELIENLICVVVFLGFGKCTMDDGFIRVEIFKFGKAERAVRLLIDILHTAICLLIAYNCFKQAQSSQSMNAMTVLINIPKYPFVYLSAFSFVMIAVAVPAYAIRKRTQIAKNAERADIEASPDGGGDSGDGNE